GGGTRAAARRAGGGGGGRDGGLEWDAGRAAALTGTSRMPSSTCSRCRRINHDGRPVGSVAVGRQMPAEKPVRDKGKVSGPRRAVRMTLSTHRERLPKIGALCVQWVRCSRPSCACGSRRQLHGPYHYLFFRAGGRLQKRYVRKADVAAVRDVIEA